MASSIVKRVVSNLMMVRAMASSSRLYNTRCFQYDERDSEDVCILKCDSKPGSLAHHAVNTSFDSRVSPIGNLVSLLNLTDGMIGGKFLMKEIPWNVVEDDKALYILRTMPGQYKESEEESVPHAEYMFAIHLNHLKDSVPDSKINMLMRKVDLEPSQYYFQEMRDLKELPSLAEPASGTTYYVSLTYKLSKKNPQAIRIFIGLEGWDINGQKTDDLLKGYTFEIFLPDNNIQEAKEGKEGKKGDLWEIIIPKKKGERIQTVGGNLYFFQKKKICKPTLWRPT